MSKKDTHADDELVLTDLLVDEQGVVLPGAEVVFRVSGVDGIKPSLQPSSG